MYSISNSVLNPHTDGHPFLVLGSPYSDGVCYAVAFLRIWAATADFTTMGNGHGLYTDMEKGADTRTLSAEVFENCGNFLNVEDYAPLFSE